MPARLSESDTQTWTLANLQAAGFGVRMRTAATAVAIRIAPETQYPASKDGAQVLELKLPPRSELEAPGHTIVRMFDAHDRVGGHAGATKQDALDRILATYDSLFNGPIAEPALVRVLDRFSHEVDTFAAFSRDATAALAPVDLEPFASWEARLAPKMLPRHVDGLRALSASSPVGLPAGEVPTRELMHWVKGDLGALVNAGNQFAANATEWATTNPRPSRSLVMPLVLATGRLGAEIHGFDLSDRKASDLLFGLREFQSTTIELALGLTPSFEPHSSVSEVCFT